MTAEIMALLASVGVLGAAPGRAGLGLAGVSLDTQHGGERDVQRSCLGTYHVRLRGIPICCSIADCPGIFHMASDKPCSSRWPLSKF